MRLLVLTLIASPLLVAEELSSPFVEHLPNSVDWGEALKGENLGGKIFRNGKLLFRIHREGNVAYLSLPKKLAPLEVGIWNIEVHCLGQVFSPSWDKKKQAWRFNFIDRGNHMIYVSKRINNLKNNPYAWFVLGV